MKKLKLARETIATLTSSDLAAVHGGGVSLAGPTLNVCPVPGLTHGCTGSGCVQTITSGTSVILPPGGSIIIH